MADSLSLGLGWAQDSRATSSQVMLTLPSPTTLWVSELCLGVGGTRSLLGEWGLKLQLRLPVSAPEFLLDFAGNSQAP